MTSPSIDRSTLLRGPGSITYDGNTFYSKEDIAATVSLVTWRPVVSTHGAGAPRLSDATAEITFTPTGRVTAAIIAALYPDALRDPVVGSRLFPATDKPLLIHGVDQSKLQFENAALLRMPSLSLTPTATAYGPAAFSALIKNSAAREAPGAVYTSPAAAAWQGVFDDGDIIAVPYSGTWGNTEIATEDGWSIEFDVGVEPVVVDGIGTVDYRVTGVAARATCRPVAMSAAALMASLRPEGLALGSSLRQTKDLVITGAAGGLVVTLHDAAMLSGSASWGNASGRVGEVSFEASRQLAGTAPATTMGAVFEIAVSAAE